MREIYRLAWNHRGKVLREWRTSSRNYVRGLIDVRRILTTVDLAEIHRLRESYSRQAPPPAYLKYLNIRDYMMVALNCAYRLNLHRSTPKTILDVSTGAGYFPYACNYFGHRAIGADVGDVDIFNDVTRVLGIERRIWLVRPGEQAPEFGAKFDLVTAFQFGFDFIGPEPESRWGVPEWEFFLKDLYENRLHDRGEVLLSGFNRPEKQNRRVLDYFVAQGADIHDGRVHFRSMEAFRGSG